MKFSVAIFLLCTALGTPVFATELAVSVEVPALKVAEYHRPYVAVWIEKQDQTVAANLAVWYQTKAGKEPGTKWLPDLRQWWRRSGRELTLPVDGMSGATRAAGTHVLRFNNKKGLLAKLPAGNYSLVVEAVREEGGRELLKIPFSWPNKTPQNLKVQGKNELGAITLEIKP
jgi:hypothetical protein